MADKDKKIANFENSRVAHLKNLYSDDASTNRRYSKNSGSRARPYVNAKAVREALGRAEANKEDIIKSSRELYNTNPIYASVISYLANMFMWRYKVTPHKLYTKSKAKSRKEIKADDYKILYNLMLETVEGLSIETKFPELLTLLFTQGAAYFTTICDEESLTIDTLLLPDKYCRKIAETQFGTAVIEFDFSYFTDLGLADAVLKDYLKSFPKEFQSCFRKYQSDTTNNRWQQLDPHFSSGFMLNDAGIPTLFYIYAGILDYEQYQDNEVERSDNSLKYLVVHKMPIYEDKLIFDVPEVQAIHQSLRRVVDTGEKARLITTFGDVHVENIADNALAEADTLNKAFKAIFNNAGFNSGIFTSESVEALKTSLIRDKGLVWHYVQILTNFYNIVVNNYFDFKGYQADIDILPISPYTYNDDIKIYKDNATLGVGKIDYLVASGIKQKHIADMFELENFLELERITPMQTSYTQTAEDRGAKDEKDEADQQKSGNQKDSKESEIEPSEDKEDNEKPDDEEK